MKLGEILIRDGLIAPWQLELALTIQHRTHQFLGEIFIEKEWVRDEQLIKVLAEQFELPCSPEGLGKIDWNVGNQYSQLIDEQAVCYPVRTDASTLWVAISNPLDAWTISLIEKQARGKNVQLVLVSAAQIRDMVNKFRDFNLNGNSNPL